MHSTYADDELWTRSLQMSCLVTIINSYPYHLRGARIPHPANPRSVLDVELKGYEIAYPFRTKQILQPATLRRCFSFHSLGPQALLILQLLSCLASEIWAEKGSCPTRIGWYAARRNCQACSSGLMLSDIAAVKNCFVVKSSMRVARQKLSRRWMLQISDFFLSAKVNIHDPPKGG
jgi:hypothetical protein